MISKQMRHSYSPLGDWPGCFLWSGLSPHPSIPHTVQAAATGKLGIEHFLLTQLCFNFPGPPYLVMSLQARQVLQSTSLHPTQEPHLALLRLGASMPRLLPSCFFFADMAFKYFLWNGFSASLLENSEGLGIIFLLFPSSSTSSSSVQRRMYFPVTAFSGQSSMWAKTSSLTLAMSDTGSGMRTGTSIASSGLVIRYIIMNFSPFSSA